jgi:hypothetical protein
VLGRLKLLVLLGRFACTMAALIRTASAEMLARTFIPIQVVGLTANILSASLRVSVGVS